MGRQLVKTGRPQGVTKTHSYEVYAFEKLGRVNKVCSLPARSQKEAERKGRDFCTMVGYDFSHSLKEAS